MVKNNTLKFFLLLAIIATCWYLGRVFQFNVDYYRNILENYSIFVSGIIFVALYVGITTFVWFGPKDVFRIAGAVLFGAYTSSVLVWIAEMFNVAILFHLSRKLGRGFVEQKFRLRSSQLDEMKKQSGVLGLLALRVNPLVPFRLMDLGFGLSKISFKKYFMVCLLVSFFRILWLQFILAGMGEALFEDPTVVVSYLLENQYILVYSGLYFLSVLVLTIMAMISKGLQKRRKDTV